MCVCVCVVIIIINIYNKPRNNACTVFDKFDREALRKYFGEIQSNVLHTSH